MFLTVRLLATNGTSTFTVISDESNENYQTSKTLANNGGDGGFLKSGERGKDVEGGGVGGGKGGSSQRSLAFHVGAVGGDKLASGEARGGARLWWRK